MELKDILQQMIRQTMSASQPTDLQVGTVTSASPLEITISPTMAPLRAGVLYLTSAVVEKKITALSHSHSTENLSHAHTTSGLSHTHMTGSTETSESLTGSFGSSQGLTGSYESDTQLENVVCYENGTALPSEDGYIVLNRALAEGDKVLLLRVQAGQKFIILSRIFEGVS